MTTTTSTGTEPRQPSARPSVWRLIGSQYVDLLMCGFVAWVVCFAFGWQTNWASLALFLWAGQLFWCRDRLHPTAGEYCLGIRYLTSSSSQVVADIQIVHAKLKLNEYLLVAGVVELTLAFLFLSGWTFLGKAVVFGVVLGSPYALVYWAFAGFAFFICGGYMLSGCKVALWVVPLVHVLFGLDFFISYPAWKELMQNNLFYTPWVWSALVAFAKSQSFFFLELFALWSCFVMGVLAFSRKHLVN